MYDELVNLLIRCGKQKCKDCEYEHVLGCVTKMNEKAADAIKELQKQRDEWESHAALAESFARGWIPVTERLPENAGVYLCRIKSFDGKFRYTDTMKYVGGRVMYIPNCEHCAHRGDCAMLQANTAMRETIWNINREASGRHDYVLNGEYFPAEEG